MTGLTNISSVEDLSEPIPSLFVSLVSETDSLDRWVPLSFPVDHNTDTLKLKIKKGPDTIIGSAEPRASQWELQVFAGFMMDVANASEIRVLLTESMKIANSVSKYVPSKKCGDPLILTPLIKKEEINVAKDKSYVTPLLPNIHSHSGYLTVNETAKSNLFFWFFKQSSSNWSTRPVVLWLQGGPGCSSMFGLFTENGPFRIKQGKLVKSKYSWTKYYNVLYIDNPIGTGYSFGSYVDSEQELGKHLFDALTQFFTLFPELRKNKFFISGESYAGKYIPVLGYEIYKRNPTQRFPINLGGLFIGNGATDPENMFEYAEHLHRLGLIDHRQKVILQRDEEEFKILIRNARWSKAGESENKLMNNVHEITRFTYLYDYMREDFEDDSYIEFMNDDDFRRNIHVGQAENNDFSGKVFKHLIEDIDQSVRPQVEELLEVYPIMFFSGQLDIIVGHYLTSSFIKQLHWSGADEYSEAKRNIWHVNDHLAGYYKSAGQMVTARHPLFLLDLLNKFIDGEI
ncbi:hypothetical protein U1Q18_049761 [Sarracenia purpurea var. burkii]